MATLKKTAQEYEPTQTKNIADLDEVPLDIDVKLFVGKNTDGEDYSYNYAELNGLRYRIPSSVLFEIQEILKVKPNTEKIKVSKTGAGQNTRYKVIQL